MKASYQMNESELMGALEAAELASQENYSGKGMLRFWLAIIALGGLPGTPKWILNLF